MNAPCNFPLLFVSQKPPFALAAGACALKPSVAACAMTLRLGRPLAEAGAPMTSDADADMVAFAGSTGLGRNAVKDCSEEKTFHIHNGPRTDRWAPHG